MNSDDLDSAQKRILGMLYDVADVGMCVTDEARRFVAVNRSYCDTYGYSESELIGHEFTLVLPEEHRADAAKLHDSFLLENAGEVSGEWKVVRKDGSLRDVLVTAGRLTTPDGSHFKVTTVYDITDRVLRTSSWQRVAVEKETLLREVHHRVKNNLNSLQGMLKLQLMEHQHDDAIVSALAESINRIKTMTRLYERLQSSQDVRVVRLQDYVHKLANDLVSTIRDTEHVELNLDVADEGLEIELAIALGLVLNELLTNSLKYAMSDDEKGRINISVQLKQQYVELAISDSGPGVSPDYLDTHGTTLGLQLVKALAEQHGGSIELNDPASSRFLVRLPRKVTAD